MGPDQSVQTAVAQGLGGGQNRLKTPGNFKKCIIGQPTRNQFAGNRTRVRIPPAAPKAPEAICFWSLFLSRRRMQSRTARIIVLGRYLTYQDPQRYHLYLSALYTDITGRSVLDQLLPERWYLISRVDECPLAVSCSTTSWSAIHCLMALHTIGILFFNCRFL